MVISAIFIPPIGLVDPEQQHGDVVSLLRTGGKGCNVLVEQV